MRAKLLIAGAVLLAACLGVVLLMARHPEPGREGPGAAGGRGGERRAEAGSAKQPSQSEELKLVVTLWEPKASEEKEAPADRGAAAKEGAPTGTPPATGAARRAPRRGGHADCPQTQVSEMLAVRMSSPHGCIIGNVMPGGPAAKAGLQPGDGIKACDGQDVTCPSSLLPHLTAAKGGKVELTVLRPKQDSSAAPKEGTEAKPEAESTEKAESGK